MERRGWNDAFCDLEALSETSFHSSFFSPIPPFPFRSAALLWGPKTASHSACVLPLREAPLVGRKSHSKVAWWAQNRIQWDGGQDAGGLCVPWGEATDRGARPWKPTALMLSFPGRPIRWAFPVFPSEISFLVVPRLTSCPSGQNVLPGFIEPASSHFELGDLLLF